MKFFSFQIKRIKSKLILGILGAIILGALGSGFWQVVLEPLFYKISKIVLDRMSFWYSSVNSRIYQDIAKGFHEQHSLNILILVNGMITGFILSLMTFRILFRKLIASKDSLSKVVQSRKFYYFVTLLLIFLVFFQLGSLAVEAYENIAITRFEQCLAIASPYSSQENILKIRSQFAQIKNKSDYENIIKILEDVIIKNSLKLPPCIMWY